MKLNLGSGDDYRQGYVNVDLRDGADVVCDVRELPYPDHSVEHILASDILEHFPVDQTQTLLHEWHRVLVENGRMTVRVPNLTALCAAIGMVADPRPFIRNIYGGHRFGPDGAWDTHHTGWTPDLLAEDLAEAGFRVESNDNAMNMMVVARAVD